MHYAIDGKYPIETKDQLTKTAAYFDKYLVRFHPKERVKIAATIEKRASELNMYLDNGWIKNYSRAIFETAQLSPDFIRNVEMRKYACDKETIKFTDSTVNIDELLEKISSKTTKENLREVVDALFEFDKMAGIEYQWDKSIVDPIMTVFGSLNNPEYDAVKIAGNITDYKLKKIAFNEAEIALLTRRLGKHFAKNFVEDPVETTRKLNPMEKEAFCNIIEG